MQLRSNLTDLIEKLQKNMNDLLEKVNLNLQSLTKLLQESMEKEDFTLQEKAYEVLHQEDLNLRKIGDNTEELVNEILTLQAPVGKDLRRILNSFRIIYDIERISRETAHIFQHILSIVSSIKNEPNERGYMTGFVKDLNDGTQVVAKILTIFHNIYFSDEYIADIDKLKEEVQQLDSKIDTLFEDKKIELNKKEKENIIRNTTENSSLFALRGLERIGDHACNLIERVIFISRGIRVKVR